MKGSFRHETQNTPYLLTIQRKLFSIREIRAKPILTSLGKVSLHVLFVFRSFKI